MGIPSLNIRWLLLGLLGVALVAGGGAGYSWWRNQPEHLYASALTYYEKGEAARQSDNYTEARRNFEYAELQVQNLLKKKQDHDGLLLQHKVLSHLGAVLQKTGEQLPAEKLRLAQASLQQAANFPESVEAQALLLDQFFQREDMDQLAQAIPHATRIVALPASAEPKLPKFDNYRRGAHFVLAWSALHMSSPQPDTALSHLEACRKLQPDVPLRWRELALETLARKLMLPQPRNARTVSSSSKKDQNQDQAELNKEVVKGLNLVRQAELPRGPSAEPAEDTRKPVLPASPTNVRGLFDFLVLAVELSPSQGDTMGRLQLFLETCERMTAVEKPSGLVLREIARHVSQLQSVIDRLPSESLKPNANDWGLLSNRMEKLAMALRQRGADVDPGIYLALAQWMQTTDRQGEAERLVREGLKTALDQHLPESDVQVLNLHAMAAWVLLHQLKPAEALVHLAALRRHKTTSQLRFMEGLAAVLDGRLEEGVNKLENATKDPVFAKTVTPHLALAYGYMGLGRYSDALSPLKEVEARFKQFDQLSKEEQAIAGRLLASRVALDLELFRCYLGMGKLKEAQQYKHRLANKREELEAVLILIRSYLATAQLSRVRQPGTAADALAAARAELDAAKTVHLGDARLIVAEINLILIQPEVNRPVVASALGALLATPATPGVPVSGSLLTGVVESALLRQGLVWHEYRAEDFLRAQVLRRGDRDPDLLLIWMRWLQFRGRLKEADEVLTRLMERNVPQYRRQLQILRAQNLLARGQSQSKEAQHLIQQLQADHHDLDSDILHILYLIEVEQRPEADTALAQAMSRYESDGRLLYLRGMMAQANGDFRQAVQAYERGLQFVAFRKVAQQGLLASLLGLSARESPAAANKLALELLRGHPDEPVLLLACAETAVALDRIDGDQGMVKTMERLRKLLDGQKRNSAASSYLVAQLWVKSGRPDRAWKEIVGRALVADSQHVPSLLLAGHLALALDKWQECLRYAEQLQQLKQQDPLEPRLWQATAWEHLGMPDEARKVYQDLASRYPERPVGYLGIAGLLERSRDYRGALAWLDRWHERSPDDLEGLSGRIRVLSLDGKADEAQRVAERFLTERLQRLQENQAQAAPAPSPRDSDLEKQAQEKNEARANLEAAITASVADSFRQGRAFVWAEAWAQRSLRLAEKSAEAGRRERVAAVNVMLGNIAMERGQLEPDPAKRRAHHDGAIVIYQAVWNARPLDGYFSSGNNLAWLLSQRGGPGDLDAAYAIVQELRKGRHSGVPISGDRLALDFLDTLGEVYYSALKCAEAVVVLKEATRRYEDEPSIYFHLGRCYARLGLKKEAHENLNRAIRLALTRVDGEQDPDRKSKWQEFCIQAQHSQQQIGP